jgi:hypothetical protein
MERREEDEDEDEDKEDEMSLQRGITLVHSLRSNPSVAWGGLTKSVAMAVTIILCNTESK